MTQSLEHPKFFYKECDKIGGRKTPKSTVNLLANFEDLMSPNKTARPNSAMAMYVSKPLHADDLDGFDPVDKKLMVTQSLNRPKTEAQSRKDKNNASALNADTKLGSKGAGKCIPFSLPWAHQNIVGEIKIVEMNKGKRPVNVKGEWFAGQLVPMKLGKSHTPK